MWIHLFQFNLVRRNTGSLVIEDQESCTSRTLINGSYETTPRPAFVVPGAALACTGSMIGDHRVRSLGNVKKSGRLGMQDVKTAFVCSCRFHHARMVCGHSVNGKNIAYGHHERGKTLGVSNDLISSPQREGIELVTLFLSG